MEKIEDEYKRLVCSMCNKCNNTKFEKTEYYQNLTKNIVSKIIYCKCNYK